MRGESLPRLTAVGRVIRLSWLILIPMSAIAEDGEPLRGDIWRPAAVELATLDNEDVGESSGLAPSVRTPSFFWTHNDSGDKPRLYGFDTRGRDLGECRLRGAEANDWEDMASFELDGEAWLLVADVGDNARRRDDCTLYLVREPAPGTERVDVAARIRVRYDQGPVDCEAVAVDAASRTVVLVGKQPLQAGVFALRLPDPLRDATEVAQQIATISAPLATAADISPDGRRAVVLTYGGALEFERPAGGSWQVAFRRPPRVLEMPPRRQGETICYGRDGSTLYLTSERKPTPLWRVDLVSVDPPAEAAPGRPAREKTGR